MFCEFGGAQPLVLQDLSSNKNLNHISELLCTLYDCATGIFLALIYFEFVKDSKMDQLHWIT